MAAIAEMYSYVYRIYYAFSSVAPTEYNVNVLLITPRESSLNLVLQNLT
jgi:hypothetical protein